MNAFYYATFLAINFVLDIPFLICGFVKEAGKD